MEGSLAVTQKNAKKMQKKKVQKNILNTAVHL